MRACRVPRFLIHITDELGAQSAGLVRLLLEEGRLRADQLLEAATALQAPAGAEGGSPADPEVRPEGLAWRGLPGRAGVRAREARCCGPHSAAADIRAPLFTCSPAPHTLRSQVLRNQFRSLVIERFVERVPPCTLPPPPTNVHPNARKRVSAPKPGSEEEAALHREQQEAAKRQEYQQGALAFPGVPLRPCSAYRPHLAHPT